MKNNRAFTLPELITVIAIIGILVAVSIPAVSSLLNRFREDYYKKLEESIKNAASNYVLDSREQRLKNGGKKTISMNEILENFSGKVSSNGDSYYLSKVVDYRKQPCSEQSYVVVSRKYDDYNFKVCLYCPNNQYKSSGCQFN